MRRYISRIKLDDGLNNLILNSKTIGHIGEQVFKKWFKSNFHDEQLFKQKADRDYQKIDFSDEKGYTYQVKTTTKKSYTFNCEKEKIKTHLKADFYVFIQLIDEYAYIEPIKTAKDVEEKIRRSFYNGTSYIKSKDLQQYEI
ncbi:MAG: hypothetical protein Unbinned5607contig1000_6 [Prokaryotic dsDNA virus sp.]|nr:MAG: hypothetical protein Unbinned5607contig1000_6 [Prokaryotic dsDNA virus sp.]|tara:strand:+ start:31087 stop:31512 length:426 start_codon:yes stop_codon:yes gene_type:complete